MKYSILKNKIKNSTHFLFEKNGNRWMEKYHFDLEVGKQYFLIGYGNVHVLSIRFMPTLNISSFFMSFIIKPKPKTIVVFDYLMQGLPCLTSLDINDFLLRSKPFLEFENELSSMVEDYRKNPIK